jgi:hypothetical protein
LQPLLRPVSSFSHMQDLVINREAISNWTKNKRDNDHSRDTVLFMWTFLLMRDLIFYSFSEDFVSSVKFWSWS